MFEIIYKQIQADCFSLQNQILSYYASFHQVSKTAVEVRQQCRLSRALDELISLFNPNNDDISAQVAAVLTRAQQLLSHLQQQPDAYLQNWGIENFKVRHVVQTLGPNKRTETIHDNADAPPCIGRDETYFSLFKKVRNPPNETIEENKRLLLAAVIERIQSAIATVTAMIAHEASEDYNRNMPYAVEFDQGQLNQYSLDLVWGGQWHSMGMAPEGTQKTIAKNRFKMTQDLNDCRFHPTYNDDCVRALKDLSRANVLPEDVCTFQLESDQLFQLLSCYIENKDLYYTIVAVSGQMAASSTSPAHQLISLLDDEPTMRLQLVAPTRWQQQLEVKQRDDNGAEFIVIENCFQWHYLFSEDFTKTYKCDTNTRKLITCESEEVSQFKTESYLNHIEISDDENDRRARLIRQLYLSHRKPEAQASFNQAKKQLAEQAKILSARQKQDQEEIMQRLQKQYQCIPAIELRTRIEVRQSPKGGVLLRAQAVTFVSHAPEIVYDHPHHGVNQILMANPWLAQCKRPLAHAVKALQQASTASTGIEAAQSNNPNNDGLSNWSG